MKWYLSVLVLMQNSTKEAKSWRKLPVEVEKSTEFFAALERNLLQKHWEKQENKKEGLRRAPAQYQCQSIDRDFLRRCWRR